MKTHLTMQSAPNAHQNAVQLGHEAYRDGIVGTKEEQQSETINAVYNHTAMAMNMLNFGQYQILNNNTIFKDIMQFAYGSNFENYINENYDSSADYWKVLHDGNVVWDGELDLYDENGQLLHHTDKTSYTEALAEHLGISKEEASEMIKQNYTWNEDSKEWCAKSYDSKITTSNEFKARYDFQHNFADNVWKDYGGSMENAVAAYVSNSELGYGLISDEILKELDFISGLNEYAKDYDNYMINYYNEKLNTQYNSKDAKMALKEIQNIINTEKFNDDNPVYNALGPGGILNPIGSDKTFISVKSFYKDKDGNITKMHGWGIPRGFAVDLSTFKVEGYSVFSNTNAFLYSNSINTNNPLNLNTGNEVRLFGNNDTTYYGHLQSNTLPGMALANLMNSTTENQLWRTYIPAGTQIGKVGNTGTTTGPHLHWEYRSEYQFWSNRSK